MATFSLAYDHPQYRVRWGTGPVEAGGAATTAYGKFVAFTALTAYSAQMTVTVIGTNTATNMAQLNMVKVSGTTTTTMATSQIFGTNSVGNTQNLPLSTNAGGVNLAAGEFIFAQTQTDAAFKAAVSFEVGLQPGATLTA